MRILVKAMGIGYININYNLAGSLRAVIGGDPFEKGSSPEPPP